MSLVDDLERLRHLRDSGALSDAEYQAAKRKLIEPTAQHPLATLRRCREGAWLAGLCSGLQTYTGMPTAVLRLGFGLLTLAGGLGLLLYTVMSLLIPIKES